MKVLLADDDALVRDGLKMIFETESDIDVVGSAANGQEALRLCESLLPDVVLMDIRMPVMDGVQATKAIKEQFSTIKVLFLTTFKDIEYIKSGILYGAEGYVLKSNTAESIIDSLHAVYNGNVVYDKDIAAMLTGIVDTQKRISPSDIGITDKELDLMRCISEGLSNREIAEKYYMSEGTVRNYISAILDKLSMRDRTQLAVYYVRYIDR